MAHVYHRGLRELIEALERKGKLVRISRPIIKETELMPLVRLRSDDRHHAEMALSTHFASEKGMHGAGA